jgi:hypothetical protein
MGPFAASVMLPVAPDDFTYTVNMTGDGPVGARGPLAMLMC